MGILGRKTQESKSMMVEKLRELWEVARNFGRWQFILFEKLG